MCREKNNDAPSCACGSSAPESCGLELEPEAGELGIVAGNSMDLCGEHICPHIANCVCPYKHLLDFSPRR